jgi:hypothetical protein
MDSNSSTKDVEKREHSIYRRGAQKSRQHEVGKFFRLRLIHSPSSSATVYQSFPKSRYPPLKPAPSLSKPSQPSYSSKHHAIHPVPSSFKNESSHLSNNERLLLYLPQTPLQRIEQQLQVGFCLSSTQEKQGRKRDRGYQQRDIHSQQSDSDMELICDASNTAVDLYLPSRTESMLVRSEHGAPKRTLKRSQGIRRKAFLKGRSIIS